MGGMTKLEPTAQQTAIPGIDDSVEPGVWRYVHASRARVIVDAADYFAIMQAAMLNARYRIFLIGWDFDAAISLDALDPVAHYNRGLVYYSLGQYAFAVHGLGEAIRLDPALVSAYAKRAMALTLMGRDEEAQSDIANAIELGNDADSLRAEVEALKRSRTR